MRNFTHLSLIISIFYNLAFSSLMAQIDSKGPVLDSIIQLDPYFSHHVFIVEKATHKIYLLKEDNAGYRFISSFNIATGENSGDKSYQGDHRTPEGIFFIEDFLPQKKLLETRGEQGKIYGVGAFTLDFPNPVDLFRKKTGGGIWIHSTDDESRIAKGLDSQGCVVTKNLDLVDLSKYIELNKTPVIITHEMKYISPETHQLKKKELLDFLDSWLTSW